MRAPIEPAAGNNLATNLRRGHFYRNHPFTETRNYVQNVLANTIEYAYEQDQKSPHLDDGLEK